MFCGKCGKPVGPTDHFCGNCGASVAQPYALVQGQGASVNAGAGDTGHPRPKDKNHSIQWARDAMSRPDGWVIMDTETTGLGRTAEIVQIGVMAPDGSVLMDSLVRPLNRKRIPADATAIHGITMKMLASAPSYPELAPTLAKILKGKCVIAYNAVFEDRLLRQTAERNDGPVLSLFWNCAMIQYARYVGKWMPYKGDYKWQKLPNAKHGAIADCGATLELLKMMANTPLSAVPAKRISSSAGCLGLLMCVVGLFGMLGSCFVTGGSDSDLFKWMLGISSLLAIIGLLVSLVGGSQSRSQ